jgi:hypothetical protein
MKRTFEVVEEMKRARVIDEYAVAGAVGALFYVEPFATLDIDLLVNLPASEGLLVSLEPIFSWLRPKGGIDFDAQGNVIIEGWPVQFLPVSDEVSAEALRDAQYLPFEQGLSVRVVRPEFLAIEALRLGRPKDVERVSLLIAADEFESDRFLQLVQRFALEERWAKFQSD